MVAEKERLRDRKHMGNSAWESSLLLTLQMKGATWKGLCSVSRGWSSSRPAARKETVTLFNSHRELNSANNLNEAGACSFPESTNERRETRKQTNWISLVTPKALEGATCGPLALLWLSLWSGNSPQPTCIRIHGLDWNPCFHYWMDWDCLSLFISLPDLITKSDFVWVKKRLLGNDYSFSCFHYVTSQTLHFFIMTFSPFFPFDSNGPHPAPWLTCSLLPSTTTPLLIKPSE